MATNNKVLISIILVVSFLLSIVAVNAQNITYNVIAAPGSSSQTVAVVVDDISWPLVASSGILYQGEAPVAKQGYHYAILEENKQVSSSEGFSRTPVNSNTDNEFFNRPLNTYQVATLPQVLSPLDSINRITSDLHLHNQIPTIHIWGNETAVNSLHENQSEDIDVELNMTYIRYGACQTYNKLILLKTNCR